MNEVMLGCFQYCLGGAWDGYELGSPMELQPNRITNQGDVNKPNVIVYPCLKLRVNKCELSIPRNAFYEESESMKPHENPQTTEYMRMRQFVITLLVYVLSLFEWLIMVAIGVGELILLGRNVKCDIVCWMCGGVTSDFVLSHSDENEHTVTNFRNFLVSKIVTSATAWHNHILLVFKWLIMMSNGKGMSVGSTFLSCMNKGREHEITTMHEQLLGNNESGCERVKQDSILIAREGLFGSCQGIFRESIGKWFYITDLDVEATKESVVTNGMHYPQLNLSIWGAKGSEEETEYIDLYPFYYGRVNCKMRIFQSRSTKNYLMLLNLSSNLVRMNLLDTREMGLTMLLNWMLKIMPTIEFKVAWVTIINATTLGTEASSDKTVKDVFEWMIAWGGQISVEFIR